MTASYETIILNKTGAVASILLNRPTSLNSFNRQMRRELLSALDDVERDEEVLCVVLGATGRGFSSGADLREPPPPSQTVEQQVMQEYVPALEKITAMGKPVIAAVPGVAAGIGVAFAMVCDLMVMAETGSLVCVFSNIGLVPDGGVTWLLPRSIGYRRAFALAAEGGRLTAAECLEAGIANKLAPADEVVRTAEQWAEQLAKRAPLALRETKKLMRSAGQFSYFESMAAEARIQNFCIATEDSREAIKAFLEKRQPVFNGR